MRASLSYQNKEKVPQEMCARSLKGGNSIIFGARSPAAAMVFAYAAQRDEPIVTRFAPEELTAKLIAAGFSKVVHLSPQAAFDRYFVGRYDGLSALTAVQLMRAIV